MRENEHEYTRAAATDDLPWGLLDLDEAPEDEAPQASDDLDVFDLDLWEVLTPEEQSEEPQPFTGGLLEELTPDWEPLDSEDAGNTDCF